MSDWTQDPLWQKAKLYAARALAEDRNGAMFPFWMTLSLELLARASLSQVHPALLADPLKGDNLLHAFGYGTGATPKSIGAKTVFERCRRVVPEFTEREEKKALQLVELRNTELHSGTPAFEGLGTGGWQPDMYRISRLLLNWQGKTLEELLGDEEAAAAVTMIEAAESKVLGVAQKAIADAHTAFEHLDHSTGETKRTSGETVATGRAQMVAAGRLVDCPSCGSQALMQGEAVRTSGPKVEDEELFVETVYLPTHLQCFVCDLLLEGYEQVHAAGLGGQYSISRDFDPMEYYEEMYAYEDEYGND